MRCCDVFCTIVLSIGRRLVLRCACHVSQMRLTSAQAVSEICWSSSLRDWRSSLTRRVDVVLRR